jgi:hypothetical protein
MRGTDWISNKLLLQSALQPLVGFGLLNCRSAFSAGRFYRVPLPAARQTPNLEENQEFRVFQLSPQEAPSVWSDASELSSGRWNYGREMAKKFCRKWRLPRHFWVLLHAVNHDMGQTALLPLRRKACWGGLRPGLNQRTWVPKASTLPLDRRNRSLNKLCTLILVFKYETSINWRSRMQSRNVPYNMYQYSYMVYK